MSHPLRTLLAEVHKLEQQISDRIHRKDKSVEDKGVEFEIKNGKPTFAADVRRREQALTKNSLSYLLGASFLKVVTAPVIYALVIPIGLLDVFLFAYQTICFPLYGISKVIRRDYVVIDRHRLPYLNLIEKFNCAYCGYANGVLAYAREIAARTEQHWCPIKHARKAAGCHSRQCLFCEYGSAESFRRKFDKVRADFADLEAEE